MTEERLKEIRTEVQESVGQNSRVAPGLVDELIAEVRRLQALNRSEGGWLPMNEAPKDGANILAGLWVDKPHGRSFDRHVISYIDYDVDNIPIEQYQGWAWTAYEVWQPLPAAPELPETK